MGGLRRGHLPFIVPRLFLRYTTQRNASTSNSLTYTVTQSGGLTGTTFMLYDITGAASSPFDKDSGGQTGQQTGPPSGNTTLKMSGPSSPSNANELIIGNFGEAWCTADALSSPGGGLFDTAVYTGNSYSGPQSVDQNNGWFHYYDPNTAAVNVTWAQECGSNTNNNGWAGRVAAFMPASSVTRQPVPPTLLKAVVN